VITPHRLPPTRSTPGGQDWRRDTYVLPIAARPYHRKDRNGKAAVYVNHDATGVMGRAGLELSVEAPDRPKAATLCGFVLFCIDHNIPKAVVSGIVDP